MRLRSLGRSGLFGVIGLVAVSVSCGGSGSSSSSTQPSTPFTSYTDTFTGTVTQGQTLAAGASFGANNQNHFTIHTGAGNVVPTCTPFSAGCITVTVTKLSPLSTITVGLGVGVYDAASNSCNLQATTDVAKLNSFLSLSAGASNLEACVGIYDVGNIADTPTDYEVTVQHT